MHGERNQKGLPYFHLFSAFLLAAPRAPRLRVKEIFQFLVPALFLLAISSDGFAQFDPSRLKEETANYRMVSAGKQIGVANVSIRREAQNEIPLIRIVQVISGAFNQTTEVLLRADSTLQAISSYTNITQVNKSHAIRLNYKADRVSGRMEIPLALGGDRRIDELIPSGTLDFNAAEFALRASDLKIGNIITFPLYNPQQGGRLTYRATVSRLEEVTVPAGTFRCRRVEVSAGQAGQIFFFDDKTPHRLILQKIPALSVDIELLPK